MDMQLQLAGIVAAAVHEGLISVHEGVCDVIDACSPVVHKPDQGRPSESEYLSRPFGQWSGCIVEQYMAASMPGVHLMVPLDLQESVPSSVYVKALVLRRQSSSAAGDEQAWRFCLARL